MSQPSRIQEDNKARIEEPRDHYSRARYSIVVDVILRPEVVASKIIARLRRKGIRNIEFIGRSLKVTITSSDREKLMNLFTLIADELRNRVYEEICFQLYMTLSYNIYGSQIRSLNAEGISRENSVEIRVVNYKGMKFWIYMNSKKKKILVKRIKSRVVTRIIEPSLISESLFITCISDLEELKKLLEEDLDVYADFMRECSGRD